MSFKTKIRCARTASVCPHRILSRQVIWIRHVRLAHAILNGSCPEHISIGKFIGESLIAVLDDELLGIERCKYR
jgi:hypothetical protein